MSYEISISIYVGLACWRKATNI